jgi:hypothetical protein
VHSGGNITEFIEMQEARYENRNERQGYKAIFTDDET